MSLSPEIGLRRDAIEIEEENSKMTKNHDRLVSISLKLGTCNRRIAVTWRVAHGSDIGSTNVGRRVDGALLNTRRNSSCWLEEIAVQSTIQDLAAHQIERNG